MRRNMCTIRRPTRENLVLFCLSCKKDIYSFNTSLQVEKEKKKGTMDINLRSPVTSLGRGFTSLRNLCMHFDFPPPLSEHSYQSYLKYFEETFIHDVKKEDCVGHVQNRLSTAFCSYKNKRSEIMLLTLINHMDLTTYQSVCCSSVVIQSLFP